MKLVLSKLVQKLGDPALLNAGVIRWASPVVSFGDLRSSKVATIGLNPSNREFMNQMNIELDKSDRRFHTLKSLGVSKWSDVEERDLELILDSFNNYFIKNPYDTWFKKLDYLLSSTGISYYFPSSQLCHLDLVPYATSLKWSELRVDQRDFLLEISMEPVGLMIKESPVKVIILNGQTVVDETQKMTGIDFVKQHMTNWTLPRDKGDGIKGYSYSGVITSFGNINLSREVHVLGYNHNIQSSYGVTRRVQTNIRKWIGERISNIII